MYSHLAFGSVREARIELAIFGFRDRRFSQLSYSRIVGEGGFEPAVLLIKNQLHHRCATLPKRVRRESNSHKVVNSHRLYH